MSHRSSANPRLPLKAFAFTDAEREAVRAGEVSVCDLATTENPPVKTRSVRSKGERILNPYEHDIQRAVVKQLKAILAPDYIVQANVQERFGGGKRAREAGQQPGWPDLGVYGDGRCWLIEMKDAKGTLEPSQKEMHPRILRAGIPLLPTCRSFDEAVAFLRANGARFTRSHA